MGQILCVKKVPFRKSGHNMVSHNLLMLVDKTKALSPNWQSILPHAIISLCILIEQHMLIKVWLLINNKQFYYKCGPLNQLAMWLIKSGFLFI